MEGVQCDLMTGIQLPLLDIYRPPTLHVVCPRGGRGDPHVATACDAIGQSHITWDVTRSPTQGYQWPRKKD